MVDGLTEFYGMLLVRTLILIKKDKKPCLAYIVSKTKSLMSTQDDRMTKKATRMNHQYVKQYTNRLKTSYGEMQRFGGGDGKGLVKVRCNSGVAASRERRD